MWSTPHPARHTFVTVLSPNTQQFLPRFLPPLAVVTHLLFDFSSLEHAPSRRSCTLSALPLLVDSQSHPFRIRSDISTTYVRSPPSHRDTTTRFDPALGESYHRPLPQLVDPLSGIPCDHVFSEFRAASTFRAPFSRLHRCFSIAPTIRAVTNIKIHISAGVTGSTILPVQVRHLKSSICNEVTRAARRLAAQHSAAMFVKFSFTLTVSTAAATTSSYISARVSVSYRVWKRLHGNMHENVT